MRMQCRPPRHLDTLLPSAAVYPVRARLQLTMRLQLLALCLLVAGAASAFPIHDQRLFVQQAAVSGSGRPTLSPQRHL